MTGLSLASFSYSDETTNVTIGSNTITVVGANKYQISGVTSNSRIAWHLEYARNAESWFAGDRVNVGVAPWERVG